MSNNSNQAHLVYELSNYERSNRSQYNVKQITA